MDSVKKCIAEFIGTFTLVLVGCGTAMVTGCEEFSGYLTTAFAFGLVIVGMAYCVGNISGCHINPAVSLACLISGRMDVKDFFLYFISQVLGAIAGAGCLMLIFNLAGKDPGGYGSNGLTGVNNSAPAGLIVEILLTFIFVLVILGVTDPAFKHGSFGGNPARSIGPALFAGGDALGSLWVFIVGPFVGAALAAFVYKFMAKKD